MKRVQWATLLLMLPGSVFAQGNTAPTVIPSTPPMMVPGGQPAPAAPMPNVALPAVTLPPAANPVAAPVTPTAAAHPGAANSVANVTANLVAANPATPPHEYSYDHIDFSIFYRKQQIQQMKAVLEPAEDKLARGEAPVVVVQAAPVESLPPEPANYPIYKLASIVYHNPADWTVWIHKSDGSGTADPAAGGAAPAGGDVGGQGAAAPAAAGTEQNTQIIKLTPKQNTGEIMVSRIAADSAELVWSPEFWQAISKRSQDHLFADGGHVKHRLARNAAVVYNPGDKEIRFTLHENQSFASAYFNCYEGEVPNATMPPLPVPAAAPGSPDANAAAATGGNPDAPESIDALLARDDAQRAKNAADKNAASATAH